MWTVCGYSPCEEASDGPLAGADSSRWQDRWAKPLGDFNHRWLAALFRPIRPIKDLLNGTWLGHPIHAAVTDLPIGTLLVAVVLDLLGYGAGRGRRASLADRRCSCSPPRVTGAADYVDTDGTARTRATLHSTLMVVALVLVIVSLALRGRRVQRGRSRSSLSIVGAR